MPPPEQGQDCGGEAAARARLISRAWRVDGMFIEMFIDRMLAGWTIEEKGGERWI
jgi:hypothetical protein